MTPPAWLVIIFEYLRLGLIEKLVVGIKYGERVFSNARVPEKLQDHYLYLRLGFNEKLGLGTLFHHVPVLLVLLC